MYFYNSMIEETLLLAKRISYSGTNPEYIGYAPPGTKTTDGGWLIQKHTYSGSLVVAVEFAGGSKAFDKAWDNRTEYDYA